MPKDNVQAALTALRKAGYTGACMIGQFVDASSPTTTIQIQRSPTEMAQGMDIEQNAPEAS
jgi:hydrogenase maturation factor